MKILLYYYRGGGGGLANIIQLVRTMARQYPGDEIYVVTSAGTETKDLRGAPNIRIYTVSIIGAAEIDRFLVGWLLLPWIARYLKADVLWAINLGAYRRLKIPYVLSIHNAHQVYPNTSSYHPKHWWHLAVLRWFFNRSLRCANATIVQTNLMGSHVQQLAGAPKMICVAPKAVQRDADVSPEPLSAELTGAFDSGMGRNAFTFLYVATCIPHKNHAVLGRAFSVLAERNVRARVMLTISPDEWRLLRVAGGSRLVRDGYIVPIGWVDKVHLRALYAESDACVMPSVLESLSSAHIEAMKWGKPQIVSDLPYARDLCGTAALYALPTDASAWVNQMLLMMESREVRSKLIREGLERMRRFPGSWDEASAIVREFLSHAVSAAGEQARAASPARSAAVR